MPVGFWCLQDCFSHSDFAPSLGCYWGYLKSFQVNFTFMILGQRFAMYEDKSVISTVLRKYKLEAITKPEEIIFNADLVLRPKYPIKIRFRHRSKDQNNIMNKNK